MSLTVYTYLIYLLTSIGLTVWVGRALFRNGRPFLLEIFNKNTSLADGVNQLLLVGFYLVNIGYVSLTMNMGMEIQTFEHLLERLSFKIGLIMIVLAAMHFLNLIVLFKLRKKNKIEEGKLMLT